MEEKIMAVCGLDCGGCPIYQASVGDVEAAKQLAGWWLSEGWLKEGEGVEEVLARGPHCMGCRGDRSSHWSANCWILECCVDDKGLEYCYECDLFPCGRLSEWAKERKEYAEALERLKQMGGLV